MTDFLDNIEDEELDLNLDTEDDDEEYENEYDGNNVGTEEDEEDDDNSDDEELKNASKKQQQAFAKLNKQNRIQAKKISQLEKLSGKKLDELLEVMAAKQKAKRLPNVDKTKSNISDNREISELKKSLDSVKQQLEVQNIWKDTVRLTTQQVSESLDIDLVTAKLIAISQPAKEVFKKIYKQTSDPELIALKIQKELKSAIDKASKGTPPNITKANTTAELGTNKNVSISQFKTEAEYKAYKAKQK